MVNSNYFPAASGYQVARGGLYVGSLCQRPVPRTYTPGKFPAASGYQVARGGLMVGWLCQRPVA